VTGFKDLKMISIENLLISLFIFIEKKLRSMMCSIEGS